MRARRLDAFLKSLIINWSFRRTSTVIVLFEVSHVGFAFDYTVLCLEVVQLPRLACLVDFAALYELLVPHISLWANRLLACPRLRVESGIFRSALASIVLFDIRMVHLALVDAFLRIEVKGLPLRAVLRQQRASQQLFVPRVASIAFPLFAFPCGWVEDWHLRKAFTAVIGCDVLDSRLALVDTFASSEVVEL